MLFQRFDKPPFAQDDAGLWAAQQLVAAEGDHIHPCPDALLHGRLVVDAQRQQIHQRAGAQILDHRQAVFPAQRHHILQRYRLGKAHDAEIAGVDLQERPGIFPDGRFIVPQMGLVGGAHLPQDAAALHHDIRDAEGAADLHQLPPGGHHLAALAHGGKDQQDGGGVVVDHHGALRAGDAAEQGLGVAVAGAAAALLHIIFQRGIAPGHRIGRLGRPLGKAGPAQIGMQHHAGGVDHRPQGRPGFLRRPLQRLPAERLPAGELLRHASL